MIDRKFLALMLCTVMVVSGIIISDVRNFGDMKIASDMDGVVVDNTTYFVYEDFRSLYSSLGFVEYDRATGESTGTVLLEPEQDLLHPRIYDTADGLLISWMAREDNGTALQHFYYDPATGTHTDVVSTSFTGDYSMAGHDFAGGEFTAAIVSGTSLDVHHFNLNGLSTATYSAPLSGETGPPIVRGREVLFMDKVGEERTLYRAVDGNITAITTTVGHRFHAFAGQGNITGDTLFVYGNSKG